MRRRTRSWKSPSFPPPTSSRPRAVVEAPDGAERWLVKEALEEAGFEVATCEGPVAQHGPCPLVTGKGCSALTDADLVVNMLGLGSDATRDVVRAVRAAAPDVPIVTQVAQPDVRRYAGLLEECGCTVLSPLASLRAVVGVSLDATL